MGREYFGLECLHRSAGVHRPPVASPWLTRLRVGTCGGVAPSAARPAPGASPSWGGSRRGLDHGGLADSEGSPGPAPGQAVGRAQPRAGGGAQKADLSFNFFFECLFSPQESRFGCGPVRCSNASESVERPFSG